MKDALKIIFVVGQTLLAVILCLWIAVLQLVTPELERRNDILQEQVNIAERAVRNEEYKTCLYGRENGTSSITICTP